MKYLKYILILAVVPFSYGQQERLFSQYMFNPSSFNAGYTGSRQVNSIFMQHRSQWLNFDGAPTTTFFNYQTYNDNKNTGLGISFLSDQLGPLKSTEVSIDYAYHLKVSNNGTLSLGLKFSGDRLNVDFNDLNLYQEDSALNLNIDRKFSPNIGDKFFVGASVPRFLERRHYESSNLNEAKDKMHFYFMSGYVFDISDQLKLKPMLFYRTVYGMNDQIDAATHFLFKEKFQLGATYRLTNAYSIMSAFQVSPKVTIGYSYDRETTELSAFNRGSHEIFLRYEFANLKSGKFKIQSPRFF
jgi:type IX secretion system PorP/SprF family membrane protein